MAEDISGVVVDGFLSDLMLEYRNMNYTADRICRVVRGMKLEGKYRKRGFESFLEEDDGPRGPLEASSRIDQSAEMEPYKMEEYSLNTPCPMQTEYRAEMGISLQEEATLDVTDRLLLKRDRRTAAIVDGTVADNYGGSANAANKYNTAAGDPAGEVLVALGHCSQTVWRKRQCCAYVGKRVGAVPQAYCCAWVVQ